MALILILGLYWITISGFSHVAALEMSNETRLIFNIFGGISCLVLPLVIYSYIDVALIRRATKMVGTKWCEENQCEYIRTEISKRHISLLYKDRGKEMRKKYRMHMFPTTWIVKRVEWL